MRGTVFATLLCACAWATAVPCAAQDAEPAPAAEAVAQEAVDSEQPSAAQDARARELFLHGDRRYAEGDYDEAIDAFEEAYSLSGRPLLLFNLANAYERAGHYELAIDALRRYTPHAHDYEARAIQRRIRHLEARADEKRMAESAALEASGTADEPGAEPVPRDPLRNRRMRKTGWILTATGGGLIAAGLIAGGIALAARSEAQDACVDGICREGGQDALDREHRASIVADVGVIGGAAALATGVVLLLLSDDVKEVVEGAQLHVGAHRVGLGWRGAF